MKTEHQPDYGFSTQRLRIHPWCPDDPLYKPSSLAPSVVEILSPAVTQSLPPGWQNIDTPEAAQAWLRDRSNESRVLLVTLQHSGELVGFILLDETRDGRSGVNLRLGYLLAESVWGQGLGSELISGLVQHCGGLNQVRSIIGGVEIDNQGSIRVLEKCGFVRVEDADGPPSVVWMERRFETNSA